VCSGMARKSPEKSRNGYSLGIDLGGTKIAAGIVQNCQLISYVERPTEAFSSQRRILANIYDASVKAVKAAEINLSDLSFAGLAIPTCPEENGEVIPECPNLPKLGRVKIRPLLAKQLGCKVALENDANCFVLGEWFAGAARKKTNVVGVTLGTGVGVGILLNRQLYRGKNWQAGEIWDQPLPDGKIVEDGISGRKIAEALGVQSGADVVRMARRGNPEARETISQYGRNVGWLLAFIGRLLDPELFVLGGSLSQAFDLFEEEVNRFLRGRWEVKVSKLGHRASVIGSAMLLNHPYPVRV